MGLLSRIRSALRAGGSSDSSPARGGGRPVVDIHNSPEWMFVATPDFDGQLAAYTWREWFSTGIDRVAELCVSVPLVVRESEGFGRLGNHPLLALLGTYGRANPQQDSFEFLESHFRRMDIFGNDIWYWRSFAGGPPDEVYQLDLRSVTIRVIDGYQWYFYNRAGEEMPLASENLTHFKRANVVASGLFWGLSPLDKLQNVSLTDGFMTQFQQQYFKTGAPAGVVLLNRDKVDAAEATKLENELHRSVDVGRRVKVLRVDPGANVWQSAGAVERDMDFREGRLLNRQAAYDALGFHVGAVSEASTEAHARVAEALVRESAWARHRRTASALNEVLGFWPGARRLRVDFEDVRATDWERESKKLSAVRPFMSVNEVRSEFLGLGPVPGGDVVAGASQGVADGTRERQPV